MVPPSALGLPSGFQFGGRVSLDLSWTLAQRHWMPVELLVTPESLARWYVAVGLLTAEPEVSEGQLREAKELREAIYRVATEVIARRPIPADEITTINRLASSPELAPQLGPDGRSISWASSEPAAAALATVARDAIGLFGHADWERIRECSRPGCSLLFLDSSRPGKRRWCSMDRCGNSVNTSLYRARRKGDRSD